VYKSNDEHLYNNHSLILLCMFSTLVVDAVKNQKNEEKTG